MCFEKVTLKGDITFKHSCHYLWHLMHYVQSSVLGSSYFSPHPGQKMFLLSVFFPEYDGSPTVGPM
jgi:hypothetical protein